MSDPRGISVAERAAMAMAVRGWDRARPETRQIYLRQARLVEAAGLLRSEETMFTDNEIYAAIVGEVPHNPTGCSAIDALSGLGFYQAAEEALERLVSAGRLTRTTPGNYLPTSPDAHLLPRDQHLNRSPQ